MKGILTVLTKSIIADLDFSSSLAQEDLVSLGYIMEAESKSVERRRARRQIVFKHASIVHPRQTEHLSCIVHDLTANGALLDTAQAMDLPSSFWLRIEGELVLRLCTVAWRSNYEMGVAFSSRIVERRRAERLANSQIDWPIVAGERHNDAPGMNGPRASGN